MKSLLVGLACLAFVVTWGAQRVEMGRPLNVIELNTHPFWCNGENYDVDTGLSDARIRKIHVWMGAYDYTNADIGYALERVDASGQYHSIAKDNWDKYTTPTGLSSQILDYTFSPDWVGIGKDEQLRIAYYCNPMNAETKTKKAHIIVLVYYGG